jgi:hypothetical protein
LLAGFASPRVTSNVLPTLVALVFFWAFETAVTILHCRRYIRDYIPEKRGALRARQDLMAKAGS